MPAHRLHVLRVLLQHRYRLEVILVHLLPHPHALIPRARRQQRTPRAPRHALNFAIVAVQYDREPPVVFLLLLFLPFVPFLFFVSFAAAPPYADRSVEARGRQNAFVSRGAGFPRGGPDGPLVAAFDGG